MPDDKHTPASGEDRGYTPSSPVKRTLAWTGLAYMVILVAMTTYPYFTGSGLSNLGPLLTVPGLIGLGAAALVYLILVVALRMITREDLKLVPHGEALARLLHIR